MKPREGRILVHGRGRKSASERWLWPLCILTASFLLGLSTTFPFASDCDAQVLKIPTPTSTSIAVETTPTAVPLPEVAAEAELVDERLRTLQSIADGDTLSVKIERDLPILARGLDARISDSTRTLNGSVSLDALREMENSWVSTAETLSSWSETLTTRAMNLEGQIGELDRLTTSWRDTAVLARTTGAPLEVTRRIEALVATIIKTKNTVEADRTRILTLQSRVAQQAARVGEVIDLIGRARQSAVQDLLVQNAAPMWRVPLSGSNLAQVGGPSDDTLSFQNQVLALKSYLGRQTGRELLHLFLVLVLITAFRRADRGVREWAKDGGTLPAGLTVLETPAANAFLMSLLCSKWIYPDAPQLFWALVGIAALIPTVLIVREVVERKWLSTLYSLVGFFLVDQIRFITSEHEFVTRTLALSEMVAGIGIATWLIRSGRASLVGSDGKRRIGWGIELGIRALPAVFLVAFASNLLGYLALSNFAGKAVLQGIYLLVILYAILRVTSGVVMFAFRSRPLVLLRIVKLNGTLIHRYIMRGLTWIAVIAWFAWILEQLSIRTEVINRTAAILSASLVLGSISLSLEGLLTFCLALWGALLISRFVRFLLEEEVYARVNLSRGLPYAISTVLHYVILLFGFFLSVAALGFDMTKFTVLAGAFGVGLAFGLQNIINNFFSGLIVLFERPIRVGDVIQLDDTEGVVQRIGIRASFIRTHQGSEVIIPNGKLISDKVTNWTFSNRQRAIEISINVAYGSDPVNVVAILEQVASEHPRVAKDPKPQALFLKFDADFVTFQLRVFTDRLSEWTRIRSDLGIKVQSALQAAGIRNK